MPYIMENAVYNTCLLNAVCLYNASFLPLIFANTFYFHAFFGVNDTKSVLI